MIFQDALLLAAVRATARFVSEVPEPFIQSSVLPLVSILPSCMATGDGAGAAYMLPLLVQISPLMSRGHSDVDMTRNELSSDLQDPRKVFSVLCGSIEHGLYHAIAVSIRHLETFIKRGGHFSGSCPSETEIAFTIVGRETDLVTSIDVLTGWSDVLTDLAWSVEESRTSMPSEVRRIVAECKQKVNEITNTVRANARDWSHSEAAMEKVNALLAVMDDTAEMATALSSL